MAASLGVSFKGAAIQRGLQDGNRGLATVRSRYQETSSEDTALWKRDLPCAGVTCKLWKSAMAL
jgi:hypothetical protein